MSSRRSEDRLYTAIVLAFLVGLVILGLLGVPALLVAAIGAALAGLAIAVFHGALEGGGRSATRYSGNRRKVTTGYAPRVLESSSIRRRRLPHLRHRRHPSPPLRFR